VNLLRRMIVLAGPLLLVTRLARATEPPPEAGTVQIADGQVRVRNAAGSEHQPAVGGKLFEGDTITTGADGELHAEMVDGGVIGLRSGTSLTLAKYRATGEATDGAVFQLLRGGFRSITGWIAKSAPPNYKIVSGTATIGVRGTDHEPHVVEPGSSEGEPGLYDQVHAGGTFIQGPTGRVDVAQGKVGFFSPTAKSAPRILSATPAFFRGGKHEARFQGLHEKVSRDLDARRASRLQQIKEQRQVRPSGAGSAGQPRREGAFNRQNQPGHGFEGAGARRQQAQGQREGLHAQPQREAMHARARQAQNHNAPARPAERRKRD
jgi:hypothetical protein